MANGSQRRSRMERGTSLDLPPGVFVRTLGSLRRKDVLGRLALSLLTALVLWGITKGWEPPFSFRRDYVPPRDVVARVEFKMEDPQATLAAREAARRDVRYVYVNDKSPLVQLRGALKNRIELVTSAKSFADIDRKVWLEFYPAGGPAGAALPPLAPQELEEQFNRFRAALLDKAARERLEKAVEQALAPLEQQGILEKLDQNSDEGNQREILVYPMGSPGATQVAKVEDLLIGQAEQVRQRLVQGADQSAVAERVFSWLKPQLRPTLTLDRTLTNLALKESDRQSPVKYTEFTERSVLAKGGVRLSAESIDLLHLEHKEFVAQLQWPRRWAHSLATMGMYLAVALLCGVYIYHYQRNLLQVFRRFATMNLLVMVTVGLAVLAQADDWRAELIPLFLFGMTVAVAYHQELALLLSAAVTMVVVVSCGEGLDELIIWMAGVAAAILLVGRVRSRKKLIYVGVVAGVVTFLTGVGVQTLSGQPLDAALVAAARFGLWGVVAGFLMAGLLPFIESTFGVLTDISLLELGDVAHPLLQELVRRAPGTYNHSINVASIGEAAAEAIGARGLLVRVGAYFHDIGKMLKPGYFVENQGFSGNRHESLVPAMSTLIIIAHIKDGADLARQHHLPEPIVDMILQHHGTTLVEYFFHRAAQQSEKNPAAGQVEESSFRYPGPRPQTKEAAVLMMADAVESACRALVEPTPARIESLVHEIAMKRLLDGQFDDCALTLRELAVVETSLAKSLTGVYHGRVKYPEQRTA